MAWSLHARPLGGPLVCLCLTGRCQLGLLSRVSEIQVKGTGFPGTMETVDMGHW